MGVIRVREALALLGQMDDDAVLVVDQGDNHEAVTGLTVGFLIGDPEGKFLVATAEPDDEAVASAIELGLIDPEYRDAPYGRCVVIE